MIAEVEKDKTKTHEQAVRDVEQRQREKLENHQLLHLLTDSLQKLPLDNHFESDGTLVTPQMKLGLDPDGGPSDQKSMEASEVRAEELLEKTFRAHQDKFDIIEKLELHGDTNNPVYLREELKRNSFLLAHEKLNSNKRAEKIKHLLEANKKKVIEIKAIRM